MLEINIRDPQGPAAGCVIWLHGLGADGADMAGLASQPELAHLPLRHIFINAPMRPVTLNAGMMMRAWYDIIGLKLSDREDKAGIIESKTRIEEVIKTQFDAGFTANQIYIAGFSQGGAMAIYTALHSQLKLGGVILLSGYLPNSLECQPIMDKQTPVFIGSGLFDPIILPDWSKKSQQWLEANGYLNISWHTYPIEHTICGEEVNDLAEWFSLRLSGVPSL